MTDTFTTSIDTEDCYKIKLYHDNINDRTDKDNKIYSYKRGEVYKYYEDEKIPETLICKSFPYTPELLSSDNEMVYKFLEGVNLNNVKAFKANEGTLIRIFYSDIWHISTHKKLNAFKSRWGSQDSFGDLFLNCVDELVKQLHDDIRNTYPTNKLDYYKKVQWFCEQYKMNKNYVYTFLIRNNKKNRIVCKAPEKQTFYYTGSFDRDNKLAFVWDDNLMINKPEELKFNTVSELLLYVNNIDPHQFTGVILYKFDNDKLQPVKVINPTYMYYFNLRENEPNIVIKYIKMRGNPAYIDFIKLYDDFEDLFAEVEEYFKQSIFHISTSYVKRYIKKEYTVINQSEYIIMQKCHEWHLKNRDVNKINIEKVTEIFDEFDPYILYRIYMMYKELNN